MKYNIIYETPSNIVNFFLEQAKKDGRNLDHLKLMKLSFFAYGWVLATCNEKLFVENIEAWKFGPVIPSIYHEFKKFKDKSIDQDYRSEYINLENGKKIYIPKIDDENHSYSIIKKVWEIYSPVKSYALVQKTHEKDSPWDKYYNENKKNVIIPDDEIKEYFVKKIERIVS